jgi:hypothetical protein
MPIDLENLHRFAALRGGSVTKLVDSRERDRE